MVLKEELRTDNEYEQLHFVNTLSIVEANCERYEAEVNKLSEEIKDMINHFHDDNPELLLTLDNTNTMYLQVKSAYDKNVRAKKKPYFGRIVLTEINDGVEGEPESLYIGRGGIGKNTTEQEVIDWRAPIATVYYENGLGKCTYNAPKNRKFTVNLTLKRTYDIDNSELHGYYDSEAASNDELLTKYLSRNKEAVLGEIIATIQKEQNDIIRRSPIHNVIVQGAAGSGKTTVAMHRISYILYNFPDRVKPADFYIIGSNRMLLNYITGVLPELDVEGFRQMTMEQMFVRLLYEQWDDKINKIMEPQADDVTASLRGSSAWFECLKVYCEKFEREYFNALPDCPLMDRKYIERYIMENPGVSLQNKVLTLNERLSDNLEQDLVVRDYLYTDFDKNDIRKKYRLFFGGKEYKESVYELYDKFLREAGRTLIDEKCGTGAFAGRYGSVNIKPFGRNRKQNGDRTEFDVYDLAALAYIYKRIIETDVISEAHHIVIDEAQDYGMMAYRVLKTCVEACTYTVMGDVSQNIRYDSGLNEWVELRDVLLSDPMDAFMTLRKSYRNTVEISEFATGILDHGSFEVYPSEPIIRHGKEPEIIKSVKTKICDKIKDICEEWQKDGLMTIAIVCRDGETASKLTKSLSKKMELLPNDPDNAEFGNGVMVLPISLTKGLEFDAVLLYEPSTESYPEDDKNAKLLYVAATRALHELKLIYSEDITPLITEPVPEDKKKRVTVDTAAADSYVSVEDERDNEQIERANDFERDSILMRRSQNSIRMSKFDMNASQGSNLHDALKLAGIKKEEVDANDPYLEKRVEGLKSGTVTGRDIAKTASVSETNTGKDRLIRPKAQGVVPAAVGRFLPCPADETELTLLGHPTSSLAVKWISKQNDGIFFQSRYGVMRVIPIAKNVARITFCKGMTFNAKESEVTKKFNMLKGFSTREKGNIFEIILPELILSVDKLTGVVSYKDGKGKEFLKERNPEPHYLEEVTGKTTRCFLNLNVNSATAFHAYSPENNAFKYVHNTSMYVNPECGKPSMLVQKDRYAIITASASPTVFCQTVTSGTFIMNEDACQDYYIVTAGCNEEFINIYNKIVK